MKSIFASKTFWFAIFTFVLGGLGALQIIHPDWQIVVMGIGAISALLRVFTTQPVGL